MNKSELAFELNRVAAAIQSFRVSEETVDVYFEHFGKCQPHVFQKAVSHLLGSYTKTQAPSLGHFKEAYDQIARRSNERHLVKRLPETGNDVERQVGRLRHAWNIRRTSRLNYEQYGDIPDTFAEDPSLRISEKQREKLRLDVKKANDSLKSFWADPEQKGTYQRDGKYHLIPQHPKNPLWRKQVIEAKANGLSYVPSGLLGKDISKALGLEPKRTELAAETLTKQLPNDDALKAQLKEAKQRFERVQQQTQVATEMKFDYRPPTEEEMARRYLLQQQAKALLTTQEVKQ
jgi:hypothetical protein